MRCMDNDKVECDILCHNFFAFAFDSCPSTVLTATLKKLANVLQTPKPQMNKNHSTPPSPPSTSAAASSPSSSPSQSAKNDTNNLNKLPARQQLAVDAIEGGTACDESVEEDKKSKQLDHRIPSVDKVREGYISRHAARRRCSTGTTMLSSLSEGAAQHSDTHGTSEVTTTKMMEDTDLISQAIGMSRNYHRAISTGALPNNNRRRSIELPDDETDRGLPELPFGPPARSWRSSFTSGNDGGKKMCRRMSSEF